MLPKPHLMIESTNRRENHQITSNFLGLPPSATVRSPHLVMRSHLGATCLVKAEANSNRGFCRKNGVVGRMKWVVVRTAGLAATRKRPLSLPVPAVDSATAGFRTTDRDDSRGCAIDSQSRTTVARVLIDSERDATVACVLRIVCAECNNDVYPKGNRRRTDIRARANWLK